MERLAMAVAFRRSLGCRLAVRLMLFAAIAGLLVAGPAAGPALSVGPFEASDTRDLDDEDPSDDVCETAEGTCTLRAAVQQANALGVPGIEIQLIADTYDLESGPGDDDGDLDIAIGMMIAGPVGGRAVISLAENDQPLEIRGTTDPVVLRRIEVTGRAAETDAGVQDDGGAVLFCPEAGGTLIVEDSHFAANATDGRGGAISVHAADLTEVGVSLVGTTVVDNVARVAGGGLSVSTTDCPDQESDPIIIDSIRSVREASLDVTSMPMHELVQATPPPLGAVVIDGSVWEGNVASAGHGGGIHIPPGMDLLSVVDASLRDNVAGAGSGGGIVFCPNVDGGLAVATSDFGGNTATGQGGAVSFHGFLDTVGTTIEASSFTANSAGSGAGALNLDNGSVCPFDAEPTVTVTDPADGATVSGTVTVAADAADDIGVDRVEFRRDSTVVIGTDTDGTDGWSVDWDTTTTTEGAHTVHAVAYDTVEQSATDSVSVTVDNDAPPTVTVDDGAGNDDFLAHTETTTFTATAGDDVGVSRVEFFADSLDNSLGIDSDGSDGWESPNDFVCDSDGATEHSAIAVATDTVGQQTESAPDEFTCGEVLGLGSFDEQPTRPSSAAAGTPRMQRARATLPSLQTSADEAVSEGELFNHQLAQAPTPVPGAIVVVDTTFDGNTTAGSGGAIQAALVDVRGSTFTSNVADDDGGAIQITGEGSGRIEDSTFTGNRSNEDGDTVGDGGAVDVASGSDRDTLLTVLGSTFRENAAGPPTGASAFSSTRGGGLAAASGTQVTLGPTRSTFTGNSAGFGGAISTTEIEMIDTVATGNVARRDGGGIEIRGGPATVTGIRVANNAARDGGGISAFVADVAIDASEIVANEATRDGGGIASQGSDLSLTRTTVSANRTSQEPDGSGGFIDGNGGGLAALVLDGIAGTVVIDRSAILSNTSDFGAGGGVYVGPDAGDVTLLSTTVSDNEATAGGGLFNEETLTLIRTTVALNRGPAAGAAVENRGHLILGQSLIACHEGDSCILGQSTSRGNNLTDDRTCQIGGADDLVLNDLYADHDAIGLNALRDNGGETLTHSLRPDSPAIDHGKDVPVVAAEDACPTEAPTDQRGVDVRDGDGDGITQCDAGAFEFSQGVGISADADAREDGPVAGLFTVTRYGSTDAALTVSYSVGGTATPVDDYAQLSGSVTIPAGATQVGIEVNPVDDGIAELNETVEVSLRPDADYSLAAQASAALTIVDAASSVIVTASDPTASEEGPDHGVFTIERGGDLTSPLDVSIDVVGSATETRDFEAMPRVVRIPAGDDAFDVPLRVIPDEVDDPGEIVTLVLTDGGYEIGTPSSASIMIAEEARSVTRTAGPDRVATAIEVSRARFVPGVADAVVLARADLYPDALAGGPLAFAHEGPVLLTPSDGLAPNVADEIARLDVDLVYLLGGTAALSPAVVDAVTSLGVSTVTRIGGTDRFDTAGLIAAALPDPVVRAYVTEGSNLDPSRGWPDAVSVSALASFQGRPLLLATRDQVPDATEDALAELEIAGVTVVGGPAAVSEAVADELATLTEDVDRLAGATRYETSSLVADRSVAAGMDASRTWLATGHAFPDALVAGPAVAIDRGVLLLVTPNDLDNAPSVRTWLEELPAGDVLVRLVGGIAAISQHVEDQIRALLEGDGS